MKLIFKNNNYLIFLIIHILLGFAVYKFPLISKIYGILIFVFGIYIVVRNKNSNNEVLYLSGYLIGSEVFLRMTYGSPNYEFAKCAIIFFMILGMFYSGVSKKSYVYVLFLLLLIPGILIANGSLYEIKKKIAFDLLGPICLGIASIYTYKKQISRSTIDGILAAIGFPILAIASYLFLASPLSKIDTTCTESSFDMSGNYGPNQVATALGIGMFIFSYKTLLNSKTRAIAIVNSSIAAYLFYRGLLTFSRGGMITGMVMIFVLLFMIYLYKNHYQTSFLKFKLVILFISFSSVIALTTYQTKGLLINRYANKNVSGTPNNDSISGRKALAIRELHFFAEKPVFGIGVGKGKEISKSHFGSTRSTHNELTRSLSEHGIFGLTSLIILFIIPILFYLKNKNSLYFLCFIVFWLLTINHSAMRIAAPSFLYALAIINIKIDENKL